MNAQTIIPIILEFHVFNVIPITNGGTSVPKVVKLVLLEKYLKIRLVHVPMNNLIIMGKLVLFVQQEVSGMKSLKNVNSVHLVIILIQEPKPVENAHQNIQYLETEAALNALIINTMTFTITSVFNVSMVLSMIITLEHVF